MQKAKFVAVQFVWQDREAEAKKYSILMVVLIQLFDWSIVLLLF